MPELLYSALTGDLLGAYYAVYNGTGRTYPEFIYENGMVKVIGQRKISYRRQPEYQIVYKDRGVVTNFYDTAIHPLFLRL